MAGTNAARSSRRTTAVKVVSVEVVNYSYILVYNMPFFCFFDFCVGMGSKDP